MTPCNITRLYRDIRVTGDIKKKIFSRKKMPSKKRMPNRKTLIDSYSKLKTKTIKN